MLVIAATHIMLAYSIYAVSETWALRNGDSMLSCRFAGAASGAGEGGRETRRMISVLTMPTGTCTAR